MDIGNSSTYTLNKASYRMRFAIILSIFFLLSSGVCQISLTIRPFLDKSEYNPGDIVIAALECIIPEGYHLYGNPLGPGIGKPFTLFVSDTRQITWKEARKMPAEKFQPPIDQWVWAYKEKTYFFIIGEISTSAKNPIKTVVSIDALICENSCLPVIKNLAITIPVSPKQNTAGSFKLHKQIRDAFNKSEVMPFEKKEAGSLTGGPNLSGQSNAGITKNIPQWDYDPQEKRIELNIWLAIILAFFAGILLNAMPCVLPVLGIKIISFSEGTAGTKKIAFRKSLVFTAGMLSVFFLLASFAAFANFSWGEQFQRPAVLIAIICAMIIFGLAMFDVFVIMIPQQISGLEKIPRAQGWFWDDFFKGIFTTILATPCSGPFLGATLAWTLTQHPFFIYMVFLSLGLGMAAPYVLLSVWTGLLQWLPKPGRWMDDLKRVMGFLLFGFALYLMIGLPQYMILTTCGLCLSIAFGTVLYFRFVPLGSPFKKKLIIGLCALLATGSGGYASFLLLSGPGQREKTLESEAVEINRWDAFTPEKLLNAHARGQHVMIDFTASWCMNCHYNKLTVYYSKEVADLIIKKNILALKADLTNSNPAAESLLQHLGSRSIPFLAIFPGDDPYKPVIMRDIVKKKDVVRILSQLAER